jgi:DNA-directed RNA polymerase specialized sigma24 family protein
MEALDRVEERRRAVALARHYRDQEDLSIADIARRLGRAEATVKAYLYDPSEANKRPADSRHAGDPLWRFVLAASGVSALRRC